MGYRLGLLSIAMGLTFVGFPPAAIEAKPAKEAKRASIHVEALGIRVAPIPSRAAERLGLDPRFGVVVEDVSRKSPAARAGLRKGDLILGTGTVRVLPGAGDLEREVEERPQGKPLELQVLRNGEPLDIDVIPSRSPKKAAPRGGGPRAKSEQRDHERGEVKSIDRIGASVVDARGGGALVRTVEPEFPSAMLQPGDVILAVNDNPVRSAEDMAHAADRAPDGTPLILRVRRKGQVRVIGLRLGGGSSSSEEAVGSEPSDGGAPTGEDSGPSPSQHVDASP